LSLRVFFAERLWDFERDIRFNDLRNAAIIFDYSVD